MVELYLELYRGHGVWPSFANLPGAANYVGRSGEYYAVLIDTPPAGSSAAAYIAPAPPDSLVGATTHGTDTLPAGTANFIPTQIGIWSPKYPPYIFRVLSPAGDSIILEPPSGDTLCSSWYMVPVPQNDGIGVWVINVISAKHWSGAAPLPDSIGGRQANLNPNDINFGPNEWCHQPLLRVIGPDPDKQTPKCGEVTSIDVTGCAPGTVNFHANIAVPSGVNAIVWDFGDGSPPKTGSQNESHVYGPVPPDSQQWIASVTVDRPQTCDPPTDTKVAIVEPCPTSCPDSMIDNILIEVAEQCNEDKTRDVTVEPVLNPNAAPVAKIRWKFSDVSDPVDIAGGTNATHTHRFSATGTEPSELTVTLVVTRADNCSDSDFRTVSIPGCGAPCPTIERITANAGICVAEDVRRITLDADINGGGVSQYIWEFGDGQSDPFAGPITTHDYDAPGTYQAKLTIVGPGDCQDESDPITVEVAECPKDVPGCTDPNAINYNPHATVDDGSCKYTPDDGPGDGRSAFWCFLLGMLISILISLQVFGTFDCWILNPEVAIERVGAVVAAIIAGTYLAAAGAIAGLMVIYWKVLKCNLCQLAIWMIIGIVAGIVATIIAWYYGNTPECIPAGILAVIGFGFAAGILAYNEC